MCRTLVPQWASNWANSASVDDCRAYGLLLGARWRGLGNVLWVMGGDYLSADPPLAKYRALLAGVRAGGARQPATAHLWSGHSSSEIEIDLSPETLDFYSVQNRGREPAMGALVLRDYRGARPLRPTLMAETWYENREAGGGICGLHKVRLKLGPLQPRIPMEANADQG